MRSKHIVLLYCFLLSISPAFAWGPEGHTIVGQLALRFVKDDVRKNVLQVLNGMPMDTAANWMDIMKSNVDYEFMRPWHYVDFDQGKSYTPSIDDNLINRLTLTYNELKHKKLLCTEQVKFDLLVLLHLMGDLQMPLHTGYEDDLGGNRRMVQYDTLKTHNLHWFWDEDIIRLNQITEEDCLALYNDSKASYDTISTVDFTAWMYDNRSLLDEVYQLQDGFIINDGYMTKAKKLVTQRLLLGGLRLAAVLNKLFYSASVPVDFKSLTAKAKHGIDINEASSHIGRQVTICEHVYSLRESSNITQLNLGAAYPASPLTVIIFGKNYANFPLPPAEMYKEKNICVWGKIEEYKGKPQIIVEKPEDITVF